MTLFRPCIDLHNGLVKQIVGSTLRDGDDAALVTNGVSDRPAAEFAALYRADGLRGGHVIMLGPGNDEAARAALAAFPGGLQIGGGITADNAAAWLDAGADKVIVTSFVFREGALDMERLRRLVRAVGRERLVLDLSCRRRDGAYWVMTDRWQRWSSLAISPATLALLADHCAEFLVHGVDSEGTLRGIEAELVAQLGDHAPVPATYAGGAGSVDDLALVEQLSGGRVDLTIGSALDIFGGTGARYADAVAFNRARMKREE
jgi:phosphoribosylformimino-5-aminoimidazole carboxamide ribotide isomerase